MSCPALVQTLPLSAPNASHHACTGSTSSRWCSSNFSPCGRSFLATMAALPQLNNPPYPFTFQCLHPSGKLQFTADDLTFQWPRLAENLSQRSCRTHATKLIQHAEALLNIKDRNYVPYAVLKEFLENTVLCEKKLKRDYDELAGKQLRSPEETPEQDAEGNEETIPDLDGCGVSQHMPDQRTSVEPAHPEDEAVEIKSEAERPAFPPWFEQKETLQPSSLLPKVDASAERARGPPNFDPGLFPCHLFVKSFAFSVAVRERLIDICTEISNTCICRESNLRAGDVVVAFQRVLDNRIKVFFGTESGYHSAIRHNQKWRDLFGVGVQVWLPVYGVVLRDVNLNKVDFNNTLNTARKLQTDRIVRVVSFSSEDSTRLLVNCLTIEDANVILTGIGTTFSGKKGLNCYKYDYRLLQCERCQQYDHEDIQCSAPLSCGLCAREHYTTLCSSSFRCCAVCGESHASNSDNCHTRQAQGAAAIPNRPQVRIGVNPSLQLYSTVDAEQSWHYDLLGSRVCTTVTTKRPKKMQRRKKTKQQKAAKQTNSSKSRRPLAHRKDGKLQ